MVAMTTRWQARQRRSRMGVGRGWRAGTLSSRLLRPSSPPEDQPERLADLGVELVSVPSGQLGDRA